MEGILKVTPERLISTADEMGSNGSQIKALTQEMLDKVNSLKSTWSGDAASAYTAKFNELRDDIEKINRMIQEHVTDLTEMAREYSEAEKLNTDVINSLAGDIIS